MEYQCSQCHERFEELVRMSTQTQDIRCPSCGKQDCRRLLSAFTGSGGSRATAGGGGCAPGSPFR